MSFHENSVSDSDLGRNVPTGAGYYAPPRQDADLRDEDIRYALIVGSGETTPPAASQETDISVSPTHPLLATVRNTGANALKAVASRLER